MKFHTLSLPLAAALSTFVSAVPRNHHSIASRATPGSKNVIIQLFEWSWDSVAAECTAFIGPAGYGFVQVSPAQEHLASTQWWTAYQAVSYQLISRRGNRAQFANMINTCHAAGVKVIHDTVLNHMAGVDSGSGTAGSTFTGHYNYPGIYQYQDFHHCGLETGDGIKNWNSRIEIQTCQLANLADLNTESEYVRAKLAAHVNDLISLGVDGVRVDAAKHIAASSLSNIMSRATSKIYVTQEFVYGSEISSNEYLGIGDVQEFRYTWTLNTAFTSGNISSLVNLDNRGWTPSGQANVFVANQDTERSNGSGSLNANSASNTYILAHVFSLAHPYGSPAVLSSYTGFSDAGGVAGGPNGAYGTCSGTTGTNGWLCQHRWTPIAGMVGFRNNVGSAAMTNWVSPAINRIAFGRGALGFVAINNADSAWTATFTTSLPAGKYCDIVNGVKSSATACSKTTFTVANGVFTATIPARSAIGLHTGAVVVQPITPVTPTSTTVAVTFTDNVTTQWGQNVFIVGSVAALGNWNSANAIALSSAKYPNWSATITLPSNTAIQYKFIRKNADGSFTWESDPNRQATTSSGGSQSIGSSWR